MIALEVVEEVGSTNDVLKARAERGAGEAALLARRQSAGRGQRGRRWSSPEGNLHLSVLLRPDALRHPGHWALLAAVALADAVRPWVRAGALGLKWPNDLLLDGAKLAGILVEAHAGDRPWVVTGFGLNLREAPADPGRATACLGPDAPAAEAFAPELLARLVHWTERYRDEGFGPVRAAWLLAGHRTGEELLVRAGEGIVRGRFAGLTGEGALLLATESGEVRVVSGEVAPAGRRQPAPVSHPA